MADWTKKVSKAAAGDLQPGETVVAGVFLAAPGVAKKAAAFGAGGLIGAAVASKLTTKDDGTIVSDEGIAASVPDGPIVVGLTEQRVLLYSHGKLSGKPKDLVHSMARSDIAAVETEPGKVATKLTIVFADGTGKRYEAPRVGNSTDAFAAAFG